MALRCGDDSLVITWCRWGRDTQYDPVLTRSNTQNRNHIVYPSLERLVVFVALLNYILWKIWIFPWRYIWYFHICCCHRLCCRALITLTHWLLGDAALDFKCVIFQCISMIIFMGIPELLALGEWPRTPLMMSQHCFGQWIGAFRRAWINNYMYMYPWGKITHPRQKLSGDFYEITIEVRLPWPADTKRQSFWQFCSHWLHLKRSAWLPFRFSAKGQN